MVKCQGVAVANLFIERKRARQRYVYYKFLCTKIMRQVVIDVIII